MKPITGDEYSTNASNQYVSTKENPIFKYIVEHSLLHYTGDIRGKSILDIGCGNGCYTRLLKQNGASEVVGVDLSEAMIQLCKDEEEKNPIGIKYQVADCTTMGKIGDFDLVVSNFVLVYASSEDMLAKFAKGFYQNLKPGGRFVAANVTYLQKFPFGLLTKYGRTFTKVEDVPHGARFLTQWIADDQQLFSIFNYTFEDHVYRDAFGQVGFTGFTYNPPLLSEAGKKKFESGYWDEFMMHPHLSVLTATK